MLNIYLQQNVEYIFEVSNLQRIYNTFSLH